MPIEKVRILSILVLGASIMTWFYNSEYFFIQIAVVAPIWFPIPLDRIRKWAIWKLLGLLSLVYFGYSFYWGDMLRGVFYLVMFCVAYELYGEMRKNAPIRLLSLVSFLIVIHMARLDVGLGLMSAVLGYLFSVVFCLTAFQHGDAHQHRLLPLIKSYGVPVIGFTFMSFAAGLVVFWVMPRVPEQSLSALPSLGGDTISGFADRVTLNDIRSLKLSRKHVMDVTPLSGGLHSRYLKGRVMDYYANGIWSTKPYISYKESTRDDAFIFSEPQGPIFDYKIDLDPLHGNVIFFFNSLVQLRGRLSPMKIEGSLDNISISRKRPLAISYYMTCSTDPVSLGSRSVRPYLQIPQDHEYVTDLANQVLDRENNPNLDTRGTVQMFLNFFLNSFQYTLDINNTDAQDPLKNFLLEKREGHCELFASSMVLMLRSQGIPARLVTGFLVHEKHPSGDFFYVTESDAHAWVETYVNNAWRTVDPTPPMVSTNPTFLETLSTYVNRMWRSMVITFDYETQNAMFKTVKDKVVFLFLFLKTHPKFTWGVLLLLVWTAYNLRVGRFYVRKNNLARVLRKLDQALQERIAPKTPREGVYDYLTRIGLEPELKQNLIQFFDQYHRFRFGPRDKGFKRRFLMKNGQRLISQVKQFPKRES